MIPSSDENLGVTSSIILVRLTLKNEKIVPDTMACAPNRVYDWLKQINRQVRCCLFSSPIMPAGNCSHLIVLIFVIILSEGIGVDNLLMMATPLAGIGEGMGFQVIRHGDCCLHR